MKNKIAIIALTVIAAMSFAACSENVIRPESQTDATIKDTLDTSPIIEETQATTAIAEAVVVPPEELCGIKIVLSDGAKIVSYDIFEGRVTANLENGSQIDAFYSINAATQFIDALVANDIEQVAQYIVTTPEAIEFLNGVKFDSCYKINELYCERQETDGSAYYEQNIHVTLNVTESNDERFPIGENEYTIYSGDASTYVGGFALTSAPQFDRVTYRSPAAIQQCYDYTRDFGFDNVQNGDFSKLISNDYFINQCVMWISDTTRDNSYGCTEEKFLEDIEKTLGVSDIDLSTYSYYENIKSQDFAVPARGRSWYYAAVDSSTDNEVILTYYADGAFLVEARKMRFTFEDNSDGTRRMISIETLSDNGLELAMGSV